MLNQEMEKALNSQINFEFYSSYLYLAMSAHLESLNFGGAAHWMRVQAKEEIGHAMKLFTYIVSRDGNVALDAIEKPKSDWNSMATVFEEAYKHEKVVTARICNLIDLARSEKDHLTENTLQWFVAEQIEEEKNARDIVDQLKMVGDKQHGLLMLDHHLAKRGE